MGQLDLAVGISQKPGFCALEDSELASLETGGVATAHDTVTSSLDSRQLDTLVVQESVEKTDGIAATTHAGDKTVRKPLLTLKNLPTGFVSDHPVKIANNHRVGMRTQSTA